MQKFYFTIAVTLFALTETASAAPITIDNFNIGLSGGATITGGILSSGFSFERFSGEQTGAGIIGTRVAIVGNTAPSISSIQIQGNGTASIATNSSAPGAVISLVYYNFGANLTSYGAIEFNVTDFSTGSNSAAPTFTLKYTDQFAGEVTLANNVAILGNGPVSVPFGANGRSNVTGFNLSFGVREGDTFRLNGNGGLTMLEGSAAPTQVPEPMSWLVFGAAAAAGLCQMRRARNALTFPHS